MIVIMIIIIKIRVSYAFENIVNAISKMIRYVTQIAFMLSSRPT